MKQQNAAHWLRCFHIFIQPHLEVFCVHYCQLHNAALDETSHLDDVCVSPLVQKLRKMTFKNWRKRKSFLSCSEENIDTHTPLRLFLIFLAPVKNYYFRFWCCVLGRWASSVGPWRKSFESHCASSLAAGCLANGNTVRRSHKRKCAVYRLF